MKGICFSPTAFCFLPSAFCLLLTAYCLLQWQAVGGEEHWESRPPLRLGAV
jgi:hypothetical protein